MGTESLVQSYKVCNICHKLFLDLNSKIVGNWGLQTLRISDRK